MTRHLMAGGEVVLSDKPPPTSRYEANFVRFLNPKSIEIFFDATNI
jgi:hypothetical protein